MLEKQGFAMPMHRKFLLGDTDVPAIFKPPNKKKGRGINEFHQLQIPQP